MCLHTELGGVSVFCNLQYTWAWALKLEPCVFLSATPRTSHLCGQAASPLWDSGFILSKMRVPGLLWELDESVYKVLGTKPGIWWVKQSGILSIEVVQTKSLWPARIAEVRFHVLNDSWKSKSKIPQLYNIYILVCWF